MCFVVYACCKCIYLRTYMCMCVYHVQVYVRTCTYIIYTVRVCVQMYTLTLSVCILCMPCVRKCAHTDIRTYLCAYVLIYRLHDIPCLF